MLFARILKDRNGGVAPLLALCLMPIMGAVAASVDYSRAAAVHSAMQSALDSTALMLSKNAQNLSIADLNQQGDAYFKAVLNEPEAKNVGVSIQFQQPAAGNFKLALSGTATVDMMFTGILGLSEVDLTAKSEVVWGIKKLNLALALDNTGSMASSGKMSALKSAAHNLLTTLKDASKTPGDIQVSIVPFAVDVNVGTGNVGASWVDWSDWENDRGTCSRTRYETRDECVSNGRVWTPSNHNTWNGCVKDRDQNHDVLNTATGSTASTKYRAHQASACPASMMTLSHDWTALNNKIDAMTPAGNTNVTIGLQMAWQTLSAAAPFNAPSAATDLDKVIILLTDGENTQNRWTSSSSSINARTATACTNVKAANIRLYTVRVIDGNASLLRDCATNPSMYYDVDEASELNGVFSAIAQNLANLRVAK